MNAAEAALFGVGYPASLVVIARFVRVVRERRWRWLAVHHLGMAAIIAGCVSRRTTFGVVVNGAWLVASSAWYALGGRRPPPAGDGVNGSRGSGWEGRGRGARGGRPPR